ncbi:DUF6286 domain-containing protein [Streptomyces sp. Z26]|uniref:DUF6286 domain-containing protein n=1 Tax=Streptomyces sp. Z26 TaxID=2500177 RepID=UPI000EF15951|nr:DUF6286 domain-containing protein [Streptomyces sp. Z26]RLL67736.1 DEAD/DEAH box helicase [Streptomyces sp. Z26]
MSGAADASGTAYAEAVPDPGLAPGPVPGVPGTERTAAADRGATTVTDRALSRIAGRAAGEALAARGLAGAAKGTGAVRHGSARISLDIGLPHPVDAADVCAGVQAYVTERSGALTGLAVGSVEVLVGSLEPVHGGSRTASPAPSVEPPPPLPPPPERGDGRLPRRTRRRPWSARRTPATALAVPVAAAAGLLLFHEVAGAVDRSPLAGWSGRTADRLARTHLYEAWVIGAAAALALLGFWLLVLALTPGARGRLRMVSPAAGVRAVLDRRAAARLLRDAAMTASAVSSARVKVGRRKAVVRAAVRFGDLDEAEAAVVEAARARCAHLGLVRTPTVVVRAVPDALWHPPPPPEDPGGGLGGGDGVGGREAPPVVPPVEPAATPPA